MTKAKNTTDTELQARVQAAKDDGATKSHRLLRLPEVEERVRIARTSIYRNMKAGTFPQPIKMVGASFWIEAEIDAYIANLMAERRR